MRKFIVLGLLFAGCGYSTTLTGTLNTPNGVGFTGTLSLALSQQAALVSTGGCGGPIEVIPNYQVLVKVVNGALIGSPTVYGNDCMLPQGTFYNVQLTDMNSNIVMQDRWLISGSSVDVGTIISVTITGTTAIAGAPGVVLTLPAGAQTVQQPGSTQLGVNNLNVSAVFTLPNGSVCTINGCTGGGLIGGINPMTVDTQQTITGLKYWNNSILNIGPNNLGSFNYPWQSAFFTSDVYTGHLLVSLWQAGSVVDFFGFEVPGSGMLNLVDSSDNTIMNYTNSGAPVFTWTGDMMPQASGFKLGGLTQEWGSLYVRGPVQFDYNGTDIMTLNQPIQMNAVMDAHSGMELIPTVSGTDVVCDGSHHNNFAFRSDTSELQVCKAGTVVKVTLM